MPKGKHGPALYELMGRGRIQPADTASTSNAVGDRSKTIDLANTLWGSRTEVPRGGTDAAAQAAVEGYDPRDRRRKSNFGLVDGRVVASLSHQVTALLVFAVMALVTAGAVVGYRAGKTAGIKDGKASLQAATDKQIESARNVPPEKEDIFAGTGTTSPLLMSNSPEAGKAAKPADGSVVWVKGYTYVCVQDFRASEKKEMEGAQEFLKARGIETSVIDHDGGDFRYSLFSNRGFNTKDPVQQQRLADYWAQIREVGKEYRKTGGRHNLEGYLSAYNP